MDLKQTLEICAKNAHNRRLNAFLLGSGEDPDDLPRNPLMGHCFDNTQEASYELAQRGIPHRIVRGAVAYDAVSNCPHWLAEDEGNGEYSLPDGYTDLLSQHINDETGVVDPAIWETLDRPTTAEELPHEASHFWVEVSGEEVHHFDSLTTYVVDTAAEARKHYAEPVVYETHPERFYLKNEDSYTKPWRRNDDWTWNPRDPSPYWH